MATSNFVPAVSFHPGESLNAKIKDMDMGIKEFALRVSKPEKTIYAVIKGESSITSDMAVAFENVTRIPAHFWMNKQRNYDEYLARVRQEETLAEACKWARLFPYAKMVSLGWITAKPTIQEKAKELLSFFQMSSVGAWKDYYFNQKLKTAFRISLANTQDPYAVSAWLRRGEQQLSRIEAAVYSEALLKNKLESLKNLMVKYSEDFTDRVKKICGEAGVKLVYTPCLPKAPIGGATRWINGSPCIQISGRYKRYDIFWFNLYHEIGHILLHGKKDVFLEGLEGAEIEKQKEQEADNFASGYLLAEDAEREIVNNNDFRPQTIKKYAKKFNTHPSIIIGRLQHKQVIPFSQGKEMIPQIEIQETK